MTAMVAKRDDPGIHSCAGLMQLETAHTYDVDAGSDLEHPWLVLTFACTYPLVNTIPVSKILVIIAC